MGNPNITISGRIGTDIEARKMPDGTQKVKFRLITSDRKKNDRGDWEDINTSGWTVVAWDKLATRVINNLSKGDPVIVQGAIKEVSWLDENGNKKKSTETRASDIAINLYALRREVDEIPDSQEEQVW